MFGSKMLQDPIIEASGKSFDASESLLRAVVEELEPDSDLVKAIYFYMRMIQFHILVSPDVAKASRIADVLIKDIKQNSVLNNYDEEDVTALVINPLISLVESSLVNLIAFDKYVEVNYNAE